MAGADRPLVYILISNILIARVYYIRRSCNWFNPCYCADCQCRASAQKKSNRLYNPHPWVKPANLLVSIPIIEVGATARCPSGRDEC